MNIRLKINFYLQHCLKYRDRQKSYRSKRAHTEHTEGEEETVKKTNKRQKLIYGVINAKFYIESSSITSVEALKMARKIEQFEARERIFEDNRKALMKMIRFVRNVQLKLMKVNLPYWYRNSSTMIKGVCGGFFRNWKHLANQFFWLTDCDFTKLVRDTIEGHLGNCPFLVTLLIS